MSRSARGEPLGSARGEPGRAAASAALLILFLAGGCARGSSAAFYGPARLDFADPGARAVKEDVLSLPFRHVLWEFKFRDEISRLTLGSDYLYLETRDHKIIAVDRRLGIKVWEYGIDTNTPLDWPPVEASGIPEEIRTLEAELRQLNNRIEDIVREKGPGMESQDVQKKRDQVRQRLRQAQDGDNVYFISRGILYGLVRTTGALLWTRRLHNEFAPSAQPFAIRSHVFIPGADLARVWALDVERRGFPITYFRTSYGRKGRTISNRPIYEDPSLYFVSHDGGIYSFHIRGDLNWRYETEDELHADPVLFKRVERYKDETGKDRERETKLLLAGGYDHAFYAIDAASGGLMWKYESGGVIKTPAVVRDETVYVKTEGGALFALELLPQHRDPKTGRAEGPKRNGRLRWKLPLGERFLVKGREHVYVLGPNHELFRLNEMSGEVIGRHPMGHLTLAVTNPVDDVVYVANPAGYVFALRESKE